MAAPFFFKTFGKGYSPKLQQVLRRLDFLINYESVHRSGPLRLMRVSNAPSRTLLARVGNPQNKFSAIHVTGSKGKGSVAALIAMALHNAPFIKGPVGLYGSPHVERVNERVCINALPVQDERLADAIEAVLDAQQQSPPVDQARWFDVFSAAGLLSFHRAQVNWAVVEVGLGGRYDSTNVLSAPINVITNIYLEHADLIGPSLQDIAYEKAGIISPSASVICGLSHSDPLAQTFIQEAANKSPPAKVLFCPSAADASILERNVSLARAALEAVAQIEGHSNFSGRDLLPDDLAISTMQRLPARQETFTVDVDGKGIQVILDGAHVPISILQVLNETRREVPPIIVLGIGSEKDATGICSVVKDHAPIHVFATTPGPHDMYMPSDDLANSLRDVGVCDVTVVEEAVSAMKKAIVLAGRTDSRVIVIGSFHLAGALRQTLRLLQEDYFRRTR